MTVRLACKRFGLKRTYKELKPCSCRVKEAPAGRLKRTYKELKPSASRAKAVTDVSLKRTYKELKLIIVVNI